MRFVYVLEDDAKFQKEIVDAIQAIDPQIQIRIFKQLDLFVAWIKEMMNDGPDRIATGGESPAWLKPIDLVKEQHQLVAVISKIEFLGAHQMSLLKRTRDLFIKKKICTQEDPTAFVLTTFDEPTFKVKDLRDRILNNIIFKPFDRLILVQDLTYAIDGRHPPSKYAITNQKTTALVEVLKDAKLEAISEVGFVTRSDRHLDKKGSVSKYYGINFSAESKISLMASVLDSKPDPNNPKEFICSFSYFGISQVQVSAIRRKLKLTKPDFNYDWLDIKKDKSREGRPIGIVIIDEIDQNSKEIEEALRRRFSNVEVSTYHNYADFLLDLDPKLVDTKGAKPGVKAFPQEVTLVFEPNGQHIVNVLKTAKEALVLFGLKEPDIKTQQFWPGALGANDMKIWKEWLKKPSEIVLVVRSLGNTFYIKPTSIDVDKTSKQINVKFLELTTDQRNQYLMKNSKIPMATDAIIVSHRFIQPDGVEAWAKIKSSLSARAARITRELNTAIFVMAAKEYTDDETRLLGTFVTDILYRPIDRSYLATKLKLFFPEANSSKDEILFNTISKTEDINIANPVQISEISEAGLVFQYYRQISIGSFRGFVLWTPFELEAPRLYGTCNYVEESSQKGIYNIHFVFFGMTDHFLKVIRIWIRDKYILSKEQG